MTERRVAEVVGERHGLRQILVEAAAPRQTERAICATSRRVGQAGAEVVALVGDEDLRLVFQPSESRGMDDPVTVAGESACGSRSPVRP